MGALPQQVAQPPYKSFHEQDVPRAVVTLDSAPYLPARYDLELNAHGATDTATITMPLRNLLHPAGGYSPDWTTALFRGEKLGNADQPVYVEIYAGYPASPTGPDTTDITQLNRRFLGVVDQYSLSLHGDEGTFSCRSLAAPLVSSKITVGAGGLNYTTTAFVQAMAARYGLTAKVVMGAAPLQLQTVLGDEFMAGIHNVGIWDLILQCAMFDDVDVWVDAQGVLWYAAPSLIQRNTITLQYGRDLSELEITHSPQFSKNVQVEVRSYNPRTRTSHTSRTTTNEVTGEVSTTQSVRKVTSAPIFGTTSSIVNSFSTNGDSSSATQSYVTTGGGSVNTGKSGFASESGKEKYIFYVRNLQPADALALSKKIWRQISMHEFSASLVLPVTKPRFTQLGITSYIVMNDLPYTLANGKYWPRRITETFDPHDEHNGWHWKVEAVNHELAQNAV